MNEHSKDLSDRTFTGSLKISSQLESNPYAAYGVLAFVLSVFDRFSSIREFVTQTGVNTATLFTPQVIGILDGEISRNPGLIHDSYLMVDLINIYSYETTSSMSIVFDSLVDGITSTRTVSSSDGVISEEALDHYTVTDTEGFAGLLRNNKTLVAIYVYLLVMASF